MIADAYSDRPVARDNRFASLDVLRGFAVLAIFAVNIKAMVAPFPFYANASLWTGQFDMLVAGFQAFLIDDKWRTVFTGLFGAGIVLIAEKTRAAGGDPLARLTRRNLWLLLFGLIHLIGIWIGDILTTYALAGFVAMLFWNKPKTTLWIWSCVLFIISYVWINGINYSLIVIPEARSEVLPILWLPDAEEIRRSTDIYLSANPLDHVMSRASEAITFIPFTVLSGFATMTAAIMLAGMALWKNGFLKAELSMSTYLVTAIIGLALALATDTGRWLYLIRSDWSFDAFILSQLSNLFNGLFGGLGYAALVMAAVRGGARITPMAMVGRMAFSNYIACSLVGTTIAGGHAFALFGKISNLQAMGIVAASWVALIILSAAWLSVFRFGPLEWLWRSLTYGKLQPILKS